MKNDNKGNDNNFSHIDNLRKKIVVLIKHRNLVVIFILAYFL